MLEQRRYEHVLFACDDARVGMAEAGSWICETGNLTFQFVGVPKIVLVAEREEILGAAAFAERIAEPAREIGVYPHPIPEPEDVDGRY